MATWLAPGRPMAAARSEPPILITGAADAAAGAFIQLATVSTGSCPCQARDPVTFQTSSRA